MTRHQVEGSVKGTKTKKIAKANKKKRSNPDKAARTQEKHRVKVKENKRLQQKTRDSIREKRTQTRKTQVRGDKSLQATQVDSINMSVMNDLMNKMTENFSKVIEQKLEQQTKNVETVVSNKCDEHFKDIKKTIKELESTTKANEKTTKAVKAQMAKLENEHESTKKNVKSISDNQAIDKLKLIRQETELKKARDEIEELKKDVRKMREQNEKNLSEIENTLRTSNSNTTGRFSQLDIAWKKNIRSRRIREARPARSQLIIYASAEMTQDHAATKVTELGKIANTEFRPEEIKAIKILGKEQRTQDEATQRKKNTTILISFGTIRARDQYKTSFNKKKSTATMSNSRTTGPSRSCPTA